MSDYLTPAELFDLTGRKQADKQVAWLKARKWRHETTDQGKPRVLRAYRDKRLLEDDRRPVAEVVRPDFSSLTKAA